MRVVINYFLQDHGNAVVKELLSNYEVAMIEKAPSGGVLIHVHSSDAERMLIGQEVNLLGRRFKVGIEFQEEGVQCEDHDAPTQDGIPRRDELRFQKPNPTHRTVSKVAESAYPSPNSNGRPSPETEEEDTEMQSAPSDEDVDMGRQMETDFKRIERSEPSFADSNPFETLGGLDCEFDTFEPNVTTEPVPGMILILHLISSIAEDADQESLPTKRRYTCRDASVCVQVAADEEVVASAKATELEAQDDRVSFNMEHLKPVTELMNCCKNMDKIMNSMATMPTAWSTVICSDLAKGGVV
ncbi:hypothetical protein DVH05_012725 [Phytophthora capsici]|nr:hypothetical protein DVH05_012725 [Phytophthora capsici]